MDDRWKNWFRENIDRGCNVEELKTILLKNNFTKADIEEQYAINMQRKLDGTEPIDYKKLANIKITRSPYVKQINTPGTQLYQLDNFMTKAECLELIDISKEQLLPSAISTQETEPDKYFRTSSTCYLSRTESEAVRIIDQRIADTLGINPIYSEGIQIQRYEVGQEFKAHTDFFQPGTKEYQKFCSTQGNRTWTFMVYLNEEGLKGGGTQFTELDLTFFPKLGRALIWNNLLDTGKPNFKTKHWGLPVEEGYKVIITKWFREIGKGPMFLD